MPKLESIGTFLATVTEHSLSLTNSGCPQAVLRLRADHKFISSPNEIAHFQQSQPDFAGGWQSWQFEGQEPGEITDYLMLFKDPDSFVVEGPGKTATLNYEQLSVALGWDGQSFDAFSEGAFVGKQVLIRTDENTYKTKEGVEKTAIQVVWIDNKDVSPERSLKQISKDDVSALNAKLKGIKAAKPTVASAAKPATPAKPGAPVKPAAPSAATPTPSPSAPVAKTPAVKPATPTASSATPAATPSQSAPKSPGKAPVPAPKAPTPPPAPAPVQEAAEALPTALSMEAAWDYISDHKGGNDDNVVADAWQKACGEVDPEGKGPTAISEEGWAQVRDIVISDLAL